MLSILTITSVLRLREFYREGKTSQDTMELTDVMRDQIVRLVAVFFFGIKFFLFAIWYRCSPYGNILERTKKVFWIRQLCDILLYSFIGYVMYLEYTHAAVADPTV